MLQLEQKQSEVVRNFETVNIDITSKTQANKFLGLALLAVFLFGCVLTIILKNNEFQYATNSIYTSTTSTTESLRVIMTRDFIKEFQSTLPYKDTDFDLSYESIEDKYVARSSTLPMAELVRKVSDYMKYIQNLDRFTISIEFTDKDNNIQNGISKSDVVTSEITNSDPTYFDEFVDQ